MSSKFSPLRVEDISNGGKHFVLVESLTWNSDKFSLITVPQGFDTDLASIPRPLWALLPPFGSYDRAGVIHDWMYTVGPKANWTRRDADEALLEGMEDLGVGKWTRRVIYAGVRLGGSPAWESHRKKDPR